MPHPNGSFTEKEIRDIQQRHNQIVEMMNRYLPEGQKIVPTDMAKKLEDQQVGKAYLIAKELKERHDAQKRISEELNTERRYPFPSMLKTDGSPQSNAYHQALCDNFFENPDKVYYLQFKKVLEAKANELYGCDNDPIKLAEYYRDHYEACENASVLLRYAKQPGNSLNEEFKKQFPSMEKLISLVAYPKNVALQYGSFEGIACPKLTQEQANTLKQSGLLMEEDLSPEVLSSVYQAAKAEPSPREFFKKFSHHNDPPHKAKEFITKYSAFKMVNGEKVYVPLEDALKPENRNVVTIRPTHSSRATFKVDSINFTIQDEYRTEWQKAFNRNSGIVGRFDLNAIEKSHQGGFFERHIWHSTSQEYKDLIKAFKDFHYASSKDFLNSAKLRDCAQAYLDHKQAQGKAKGDMDATSLGRTEFAEAILKTIDQHDALVYLINEHLAEQDVPKPVAQNEPVIAQVEVEELLENDNEILQQAPKEVYQKQELDEEPAIEEVGMAA